MERLGLYSGRSFVSIFSQFPWIRAFVWDYTASFCLLEVCNSWILEYCVRFSLLIQILLDKWSDMSLIIFIFFHILRVSVNADTIVSDTYMFIMLWSMSLLTTINGLLAISRCQGPCLNGGHDSG